MIIIKNKIKRIIEENIKKKKLLMNEIHVIEAKIKSEDTSG